MILYVLGLAIFANLVTIESINVPKCHTCKYTTGVSYMAHEHCGTYIKCSWVADENEFSYELKCCNQYYIYEPDRYPPGCYFQTHRVQGCKTNRFYGCPREYPSACPEFRSHPSDTHKYLVKNYGEWIERNCSSGTIYNHEKCTCVIQDVAPAVCDLLLDFDFDTNVVSTACESSVGQYYGDPTVYGGYICFDGERSQFFLIKDLVDFFSIERTSFTVSFWFQLKSAAEYQGLFSTNCLWRSQGSPVEVLVIEDELAVVLGGHTHFKKLRYFIYTNEWYNVAITCVHNDYEVYVNGALVFEDFNTTSSGKMARTFTESTLGYVEEDIFMTGCIDDFLFYSYRLSEEQIYNHTMYRTRYQGVPEEEDDYDYSFDFY